MSSLWLVFTRLNTKTNAPKVNSEMMSDPSHQAPVAAADVWCNQKPKIEKNLLNRSQLERQLVASCCMFATKPRSITYILAIAGWPSPAKQCPFNMIRTDYGVVCTSKEPGPIITPAFQRDSHPSPLPQRAPPLLANTERKGGKNRAQASCNTPEAQC